MLSVIIPAYNVNKYICECIDSLIFIEDIEIIVVDDGSVQDLSFVRNKYNCFENFKYYKKENGGLSSARNYGIKKANEPYVMFLDGDDFIDTEKLIKTIKFIKVTNEDVYYFKYVKYFDKSKIFINEKKYAYDFNECISIEDKTFVKDIFEMVAWRYIIKREIILSNNLFFFEGIYHEDEEWTPRLLISVDKIYNLKEYILFYRQRENSIMRSLKYKNIIDVFKIINILEEHSKSLYSDYKIKFIRNRILTLYKGILFTIHKTKLTTEEKRTVIEELKLKKKNIMFDTKLKNRLVKFCPLDILLFLTKIINTKTF